MARNSTVLVDLPDLVIANGAAVATTPLPADVFAKYDVIGIVAPATLDGTVTVAAYDADTGGTPVVVQSPPGTDVSVPANRAIALTALPFPRLTLTSSVNQTAQRTFKVFGQKQIVYNSL